MSIIGGLLRGIDYSEQVGDTPISSDIQPQLTGIL